LANLGSKKTSAEVELAEKLNILRAGVLGANDGIVSVAGVVVGFASATNNTMGILLAGISAVIAGAFSMAGGEYVSVSTQKDTEIAAIELQKKRLSKHFYEETEDVVKFYEKQGIDKETAHRIAQELMKKNALEITVHQKYNLELGEYTNPWHAAFSSMASFTIGSLLPMLTILLFPPNLRIAITFISVTIALFFTGFVSATLGRAPRKPAVIRNILVGILTMTVTYLVGHLFKI